MIMHFTTKCKRKEKYLICIAPNFLLMDSAKVIFIIYTNVVLDIN